MKYFIINLLLGLSLLLATTAHCEDSPVVQTENQETPKLSAAKTEEEDKWEIPPDSPSKPDKQEPLPF